MTCKFARGAEKISQFEKGLAVFVLVRKSLGPVISLALYQYTKAIMLLIRNLCSCIDNNQLLGEVLVITLTETLIILDITKTESNNCFIIH